MHITEQHVLFDKLMGLSWRENVIRQNIFGYSGIGFKNIRKKCILSGRAFFVQLFGWLDIDAYIFNSIFKRS